MQPYYYRITHINSGKIYIGSQYGKRSKPNNFFKTYFTSSKEVQRIIKQEGKNAFTIIKIVATPNARNYERKILKYWFFKLGKQRFMARFINRNISPGILMDDITRERLAKDPIKNAKIAKSVSGNTNVRGKAWWNNGVKMKRSVECPGEDWVRGGLKHSEETKKKRSESHKGKLNSLAHNQNIAKGKTGKIKVVNSIGQVKYCNPDDIPEKFYRT